MHFIIYCYYFYYFSLGIQVLKSPFKLCGWRPPWRRFLAPTARGMGIGQSWYDNRPKYAF